jgi:hypothetical protein
MFVARFISRDSTNPSVTTAFVAAANREFIVAHKRRRARNRSMNFARGGEDLQSARFGVYDRLEENNQHWRLNGAPIWQRTPSRFTFAARRATAPIAERYT